MPTKEKRITALLCYVWIIGLILFFAERRDSFVRFNAAQACVLLAVLVVASLLGWIPLIGWLLCTLLYILGVGFSIICAINCWNGRSFRVPVVADFADMLMRAL